MENLLEKLNPEQRLAGETTEGPVLILAGAGTGKTRALTFRMANLIAKGTPADAILAVTFTNKAAEEMQTRVSDLLLRAGVPPERPWISTFHSMCARILRREAMHAGLAKDFAIYDDDDQLAAVKLAMAKLQIDDDALTPRNVLSRISYAKNHAQTPEQMRAEAFGPDTRKVADIYAGYETLLKHSKAVDFDDLLLRSARDAQADAECVGGELERILGDDSDQTCAVEYRTNFQSRSFEEAFRRRGVRYKLVGGFSFYNRAEVKDTLAYVRLALHPEDDISLLRVLNVPARGIGKTTVEALRDVGPKEGLEF